MLGLSPMPPLHVGDLGNLGKVLGQPKIKMLGRKGEASYGGKKRQLGMSGGNYQVPHGIRHTISPLTNTCQEDREGSHCAAMDRTQSPASGGTWVRTAPKLGGMDLLTRKT